MKHRRGSGSVLPTLMAAAAVLALASSGAYAQCVTSLPAGSIGPKTIVGQGPNGEKAASVDALHLQLRPVEIHGLHRNADLEFASLDFGDIGVAQLHGIH